MFLFIVESVWQHGGFPVRGLLSFLTVTQPKGCGNLANKTLRRMCKSTTCCSYRMRSGVAWQTFLLWEPISFQSLQLYLRLLWHLQQSACFNRWNLKAHGRSQCCDGEESTEWDQYVRLNRTVCLMYCWVKAANIRIYVSPLYDVSAFQLQFLCNKES